MRRSRGARLAGASLLALATLTSSAATGEVRMVPSLAVSVQLAFLHLEAGLPSSPTAGASPPSASSAHPTLPPIPAGLSEEGIPVRALVAYRSAAERVGGAPSSCRLPWPLLAAIGLVESAHGSVHDGAIGADGVVAPPVLGPRLDGSGAFALIRDSDGGRLDGDPGLDRAVGPVQFIPQTWAQHGVDGDGDGRVDPHDLDDAALSAGRYLCHTSRRLDRPAGTIAAVFSYNHSYDYVRTVLTAAARYAGQSPQRWGVGLVPAPTPASPSPSPSPVASSSPSPSPSPDGAAAATSSPAPEPDPTPGPDGSPASPEPADEPSPTPSSEEDAPEAEPTEQPEGSATPSPAAPPSPTPTAEGRRPARTAVPVRPAAAG